MTSEIITRAEKAIRANRHHTTEVQAREAIRSLMEPSDSMIAAGQRALMDCDDTWQSNAAWRAMVDEALKP